MISEVDTIVYRIEDPEGDLTAEDISAIVGFGKLIKKGGLVAFPTETVYGLGGDALNEGSSEKIYKAKGRPSDNPLIVHICEITALEKIALSVPDEAYALAKKFWPGPLTMVLKAADNVPRKTTGGLDTVAVRMPDNKAALELIKASGGYIAAPSANLSGKPSPTSAKFVLEDMDGRIDAVIDGGEGRIGIESTIVDLTGDKPEVLRPGFITNEMLSEVLGVKVGTDPAVTGCRDDVKPKAPGMKYRHYAPKGDVRPVKGSGDKVFEYISAELKKSSVAGLKTGVFCSSGNASKYDADVVRCAGRLDDAEAAAKVFYRTLREMDDENVDVIFVENFSDSGVGEAFWNRLLKSAGSKWEEAK